MPLSQNMSMTELSRFRTRICERKALHGVCELDERCPFSHCLSWHRRNPYEYAYRPNLCPNVVFQNENKKMRVKNYCQRGRMCMFSHTKEEQMYHVLVYKTQLCREYPLCTKHYCPFAHGLDELRSPESIEFEPVQGPEVIERQRLVHDCNKFNDTEILEDINDPANLKNKESSSHGTIEVSNSPTLPNSPMCSNVSSSNLAPGTDLPRNSNKHSPRNKSNSSSNTNSSPRRGGRNCPNKNGSHHSKALANSSEPSKGELTPINNTNESPLTPSTGCETPLHSHSRLSAGFKGDSRKSSSKDNQRKETDRITASSPSRINELPLVIDGGDDMVHARDNVNIPPPPYTAIGLNFPCNGNKDHINGLDNSLLPNYDFGRFTWGGDFDNRAKNTGLNGKNVDQEKIRGVQQDALCGVDDYGNGTSVEQMSYLMHLQLLSLSDSSEKIFEGVSNDPDWNISNPTYGLHEIYNNHSPQHVGDANSCLNQCNFSVDLSPNSISLAPHNDTIRCQNEMKNIGTSQLYLSNNNFEDYGFDFINDTIPNQDKMGIRDVKDLINRSDAAKTNGEYTENSWNLFHPSLFGTGNKNGEFWTEGKWENIPTKY
ncbi:zinc finger, CCCH type domain-containing protein [Cryptosporidium felis]|nr:zinc finger, CCCH type domain-containing protein [Cryptosporidium felis]